MRLIIDSDMAKMPRNCHECYLCYGGWCTVMQSEQDGMCPDSDRPGLYVMQGNTAVKVGNFASESKAKLFQTYLEYMCGLGPEPDSLEKEE